MRGGAIRARAGRLALERFDLVHIQTPFVAHYRGLELARRFGVPAVETYHTFFEEYLFHYVPFLPKGWLRAAARRFSRTQGNSVAALVVPSTAMREVLGGYGVTTPMHVVPTGIPLAEFGGGDGARFRARLGIAAATPLLLFVGRVAHEKNIGFLLRALELAKQQVPGLEMVIAGEGPAEASLRREAARLGLAARVHFVGYLDRKGALLDCYAAADAFVFASRTETQGLVLLEAMARRLAGGVDGGDGHARHRRASTWSTGARRRRTGLRCRDHQADRRCAAAQGAVPGGPRLCPRVACGRARASHGRPVRRSHRGRRCAADAFADRDRRLIRAVGLAAIPCSQHHAGTRRAVQRYVCPANRMARMA